MNVVEATRPAPEPAASSAAERRKGNRLLVYWQGLRRGRPCPSIADLDPREIAHLWRHCFTAAAAPGGPIYTHVGDALRGAYGVGEDDGLSTTVRAMIDDPTWQAARDVRPVMVDSATRNPWGDELLYRAVALPLSDDQERASHVLGLVDFITLKRVVAGGITVETACAPEGRK